jgi:hypothetical protein
MAEALASLPCSVRRIVYIFDGLAAFFGCLNGEVLLDEFSQSQVIVTAVCWHAMSTAIPIPIIPFGPINGSACRLGAEMSAFRLGLRLAPNTWRNQSEAVRLLKGRGLCKNP